MFDYPQTIPIHDDKLMQAFRFTAADLETNRQGLLSERQKARLRWQHRVNLLTSGGLVVMLAAFGLLAAVFQVVMVTLCVWTLAAMIGVLLWRQRKITQTNLTFEGVESVQGTATITRRERATGDRHVKASSGHLSIGAMQFDLTDGQYRALNDGGLYTVYYLSGVIVAVERHDMPFFG